MTDPDATPRPASEHAREALREVRAIEQDITDDDDAKDVLDSVFRIVDNALAAEDALATAPDAARLTEALKRIAGGRWCEPYIWPRECGRCSACIARQALGLTTLEASRAAGAGQEGK